MTAFDISVELRHLFQKKNGPIKERALTTHTSHRHDTFGMTICIQRRQLDIWIDLEMISLFGGQELLNTEICWKYRCSFFLRVFRKERRGEVMWGKVREGKVRRQGCGRGQVSESAKKNAKKEREKKWKKRKIMWKKGKRCEKVQKKGQRDPHSHRLTEVSSPYLSLSPQFLSTRPAPVPGPLFTFSVSWAQHLFQVHTAKKKKSAVDLPHFL